MTTPVWEALPNSRTLMLNEGPGGPRLGGWYIAVRPEGPGWHWGVVSAFHRLIGSGQADTADLARQVAEARLPKRLRRRLAVNAESTFR